MSTLITITTKMRIDIMSKLIELNEKELGAVSGGCNDPRCVVTKLALYAAVTYGVAVTLYAAFLKLDNTVNTYLVEHPILNLGLHLGVQGIGYGVSIPIRCMRWILVRP
jgi:hypothetical protein